MIRRKLRLELQLTYEPGPAAESNKGHLNHYYVFTIILSSLIQKRRQIRRK
jgi:hypothetical protein